MLLACNRALGGIFGAPDLCFIPGPMGPLPAPLVNMGMNAQAMPFSLVVKICMAPALNMASKYLMTMLDEAGTAGPMKLAGEFVLGSFVVFIDGMPAVTLTCIATGNDMACPMSAVLYPSLVNVFFCYVPSGHEGRDPRTARGRNAPERPLSADELATLRDEVVSGRVAGEARGGPVVGAMLADGVAHMEVAVCTADLSRRLHNEIRRLGPQGLRALVLDLRGNPGGDVDGFLRAAEDFLPEGAVLARVLDADGDEIALEARGGGAYTMPVVVLVNGSTASAGELLAGCLQAHGRALVVGERTYGKGIAQRIAPSADGRGVVLAAAARYRLPNGDEVEGVGLQPDIVAAEGDALRVAWQAALAR